MSPTPAPAPDSQDQAATPRGAGTSRRWRRELWRWSVFALLMLAALLLCAVLALLHPGGWQRMPETMARLKPWFVAVHLLLIGLLWWKWVPLVQWQARRKGMPDALRDAILKERHRAAAILLVMELVLVLRVPFSWFN